MERRKPMEKLKLMEKRKLTEKRKPMEKLTREEAIKRFRKHWDDLAKNPGKEKNELLEVDIFSSCWLCQYKERTCLGGRCLTKCPIQFTEQESNYCSRSDSPYYRWQKEMDERRRPQSLRYWARKVRDLPERKT